MAKPPKYPRKLRQRLERIASAREEREEKAKSEAFDPFRTFGKTFIPANSVAVMYGRIDEAQRKLTISMSMRAPRRPEVIHVTAPWIKHERDVSS